MLAAALLTVAIVLGEFTMASLSLFNTFPVYVDYIGQTQAGRRAALTIVIHRDALGGDARAGRRDPRAGTRARAA